MSSLENKNSELTSIRETSKENDPYAIFENVADTLWERTELAIEKNEAARISDDTVAKLMTTALKLYAAKTDGEGRTFRPVLGKYDEIVTPTEALTAVTEVLRALRLGPMEFGLWSRRRPEDYHDTDFEMNPNENTIK